MIFFITNLSPFPSSVISSSIYFSSKCAFDLSLQTFLEGLTISYSGESVVSSSFFFFLLLKAYYLKSLMRLSIVSIVKRKQLS
jgi:hypothetical protein